MLFHAITIVAIIVALDRAIGVEGITLLLFLIALPFVVALIAFVYVRTMSWLFDVIVGPILLR